MNEKSEPKADAKATAPAPAPAPAAAAPAAAAPAKKKKKTGLIIGIIIAILALAGAGVAAYFLFFNKTAAPEDAVTNTLEAVAKGNGVALNGVVKANGYEFPVSGKFNKNSAEFDVSIDLSKISTGSLPLSGSFSAKAILKDEKVYLKISGIKEMLGSYASLFGDYFDFDGQWYGGSVEDIMSILPIENTKSIEDATKCYNKISSDDLVNALLDAYKNNKFIEATKYEGSEVEKKSSDLYTLKINDEKSAAFKKAIEGNSAINEVKACSSSSSLQSNSLGSDYVVSTGSTPVYAEVSGDKISRLVLKNAQAAVDFDLTYQNVNIEAPSDDVKPLEDLIKTFSMFMGGTTITPSYNFQTPNYYDYDLDDYDLDDIDLDDFDLSDYGIDLDDLDLDSLNDLDLDSIDYEELLKSLGY